MKVTQISLIHFDEKDLGFLIFWGSEESIMG